MSRSIHLGMGWSVTLYAVRRTKDGCMHRSRDARDGKGWAPVFRPFVVRVPEAGQRGVGAQIGTCGIDYGMSLIHQESRHAAQRGETRS